MPTIKQLPTASSVGATDILPVSQTGVTRGLSVGGLLSSVQPALTLAPGNLLGRVSAGAGGPEVVTVSSGLALTTGGIEATGADHLSLPVAPALGTSDEVVVNSGGAAKRIGATALRGLFTAGSGVTIGADGQISSIATGSSPATAATIGGVKPGAGLSVTTDGTLAISQAFTIGVVPSILHSPYGSASQALGTVVVQSSDSLVVPSTRQFGSVFGMSAYTGQDSGDTPAGDRSTIYAGMAAQGGAGSTRALTVGYSCSTDYAGHVAAGVKVDVSNAAPNRGDAVDYAGQRLQNDDGSPNPVMFTMTLDGSSPNRITGGLRIAGAAQNGASPLYNYGITVDRGSVRQVTFGDFSNSDRSIADFGSHRHWADVSNGSYSQSALLLGAGQSIGALDSSKVERLLLAKRASDGAVLLGDGDAAVMMAVTPHHPTPPLSDSSDASATTAFVAARIAALGNGSASSGGQGFTFRGAWTANTAYAAYDVVTNGGQTYVVTSGFTSGASFSAANLTLWAARGVDGAAGAPGTQGPPGATGSIGATGQAGATGAQGPAGAAGQGFNFRGAWTANTAYAAYDVLTNGGQTYVVTSGFTSGASFSSGNLTLWAVKGADGVAGATGPQGPAGASLTYGGTTVTSGASYAMATTDDIVLVNKTNGSATAVSLPASPTTWRAYNVKDGKGDAGTNSITITDPGGKTIDGTTSLVINTNRGAETLRWTGVEWSIF